MLKTIKIPVTFLALVFVVFLSKTSYAYQDGRDDGRRHHEHGFHARNPDLTLVTGMDDIDSRVLVDTVPDPTGDDVDQSIPTQDEVPAQFPSQMIISDADGNFIVNVPNNTGGHTPIRIQKSGNGYVGPQGEFYYPFPDISQLKSMYGI